MLPHSSTIDKLLIGGFTIRTFTVCEKCGHSYNEDNECFFCPSKEDDQKKLTQAMLKELLLYDTETGVFTRRVSSANNKVKVGDVTGNHDSGGYLRCLIGEKEYRMHRLAFLYMEGYFPEHQVDHINGVRDDNRWHNLRHVSSICNAQNTKLNTNNTSGFPGVTWCRRDKKWKSACMINRKCINIGRHKTKLEAALTRLTFEIQCEKWHCNERGELVNAIKAAWPQFNLKSVS